MKTNQPFTFTINGNTLSRYDNHIQRHLSAMRGQYADADAFEALLAQEDVLLYDVYAQVLPEDAGELPCGLSVIHAGKVGDEYFMTKGHFHAVLETGEVYQTLQGEGLLVMETPEGEWAIEKMFPGSVTYVPPRWAHRTVNTGSNDLIFFWVFPGNAGHDYGTIEEKGFRKLVLEVDGTPTVVDNPRWESG